LDSFVLVGTHFHGLKFTVFIHVFYSLHVFPILILMFDLQLPMPSVSIFTHVMSLNPAHGEVYSIQHYLIWL